jgi:NAD(P)-dependent dehydrogenase (short-subunit alcohol dehydrogenase family)
MRSDAMDFRDRHVIVTGGTGALGVAVVGALLERGAVCHVPARSETSAESFPFRSKSNVRVSVVGSLTDEAAVTRFYSTVPDLWASIHLVGGFASGKLANTAKADFMKQVETNLVTCFLCCHAAVNAMKSGGRIVNVAARPALEWRHGAGMTAYAASKAAVAALTVALAEEVVKEGILVNAVAPSTMDTRANRESMPKAKHDDWPKVEEVAEAVLFFASPENRVTRGTVAAVYGKA